MSFAPSHSVRTSVRPRAGLLSLTCAGLLWGTGGVTGAELARVAGVSPLAVATYRLAIGGLVIVTFLTATGRPLPRGRAAWTRIGAFAALTAVYQACYFTAVALTSVSLATLVTIGASPVLVLLAEAALGRRRLDARGAGTVGLALAGLALLVGLPSGGFGPVAVLAGAALALVSAAGFATLTLLAARPVPSLDVATTAGYGFTLGGLALAAVTAPTTGLGVHPSVAAFTLVAVLGTGATAIAYCLYFRGLTATGPRTGALLALLEPLTGSLLAAMLFGDRLGLAGSTGAVLLGAAVVFAALAPAG